MSVMLPGFGGQSFDPVAPERIRRLREMAGEDLLISVDGGVNRETVGLCAEAGADMFVTGSALFSENDYGRFISEVTALAKSRSFRSREAVLMRLEVERISIRSSKM